MTQRKTDLLCLALVPIAGILVWAFQSCNG